MDRITVVLNGYKRLQHLEKQLNSVNNQTVKAHEILFWQNGLESVDPLLLNNSNVKFAKSNTNFGVWARFAFALNARTEYICVIDDDTMIGERWFENCLNTIKMHNGLLGTIGIEYHTMNGYFPSTRHGWANPNETTVEVDIVGHAWFFRREWLSYLWRELPDINDSPIVGEDIHFSHMLWKYGKIKTFVPPHPKNDLSLWGSVSKEGIGSDDAATYRVPINMAHMNMALLKAFGNGFIPVRFRSEIKL